MSRHYNNNDDSDDESSSSSSSSSCSSTSHPVEIREDTPLLLPPQSSPHMSVKMPDNTKNINVMVLTVFLMSIGFTLMLPSMLDYLNSVNKNYGDKYNGLVTAVYSAGQFVASPIFGFWGNRRPTREPLIISIIISIIGNALYAVAYLFGDAYIPVMVIARFIVGVGAGNVSVCRAYASEASDLSNKTQTMAKMSGAQGAGFVLGPAFGFALSYLGNTSINGWQFSQFTAPGYLSVLFAVINVIVLILFFDPKKPQLPDHLEKGSMINTNSSDEIAVNKPKEPEEDRLPVFVSIYLFAVVISIFAVFESVMAMMTLKYYGWGPRGNGFIMGASGLLSVVVFIVISTPIIKKIDDRKTALFGFINLFIALLFLASYDNGPFKWEKGLPKWQLVLGAVFVSIGYPIASSLIYAIFSKVLNPKLQGTKMGWLTAGGSLARMLGPLWSVALFNVADDILYFSCAGLTVTGIIVLLIFYKRLTPHKDYRVATVTQTQTPTPTLTPTPTTTPRPSTVSVTIDD